MKNKIKYIMILFISLVSFTNVYAKSNPYPHYEDLGFGKIVNCTWYAWDAVKTRNGIELPTWYNVWTWHKKAEKDGFSVGKEPKKNSLMIWNYGDGFGGHVAYVTKVESNVITYDEGGAINSTGVATNQTITLDEVKAITTDYGFIYLDVPRKTTTTKAKTTTTKKTTTKTTTSSTQTTTTTTTTTTTLTTQSTTSTEPLTTTTVNKTNNVDKDEKEESNYLVYVIGIGIIVILSLAIILLLIKK